MRPPSQEMAQSIDIQDRAVTASEPSLWGLSIATRDRSNRARIRGAADSMSLGLNRLTSTSPGVLRCGSARTWLHRAGPKAGSRGCVSAS